jgi:hypothetical protein
MLARAALCLQLVPSCKVSALPKQDNHCDCGLFVLAYLEYFVHANPPALSQKAVTNPKGAHMGVCGSNLNQLCMGVSQCNRNNDEQGIACCAYASPRSVYMFHL